MHRNAPFWDKISKKNSGEGAQQAQAPGPSPVGEGTPPPQTHPLGACGASTSAPPFTNPGSALESGGQTHTHGECRSAIEPNGQCLNRAGTHRNAIGTFWKGGTPYRNFWRRARGGTLYSTL